MGVQMIEIFLMLISAHFVADFLLQSDRLHRSKTKLSGLLLHAIIVAAVSYLFLQQWRGWWVPVLVGGTHFFIDFVKQRCADTWRVFCVDQLAHILCLLIIVALASGSHRLNPFDGIGAGLIVLLGGFAVTVFGAGHLVGKVADQLQHENELAGALSGLKNGGKLIGQLERGLIFLLVLIGQPGGIGLLVAAKSILRFSEAKESQKLAEYVLIGTLLSFGLAIAAASITIKLAKGVSL
jgi:hypothetical protein